MRTTFLNCRRLAKRKPNTIGGGSKHEGCVDGAERAKKRSVQIVPFFAYATALRSWENDIDVEHFRLIGTLKILGHLLVVLRNRRREFVRLLQFRKARVSIICSFVQCGITASTKKQNTSISNVGCTLEELLAERDAFGYESTERPVLQQIHKRCISEDGADRVTCSFFFSLHLSSKNTYLSSPDSGRWQVPRVARGSLAVQSRVALLFSLGKMHILKKFAPRPLSFSFIFCHFSLFFHVFSFFSSCSAFFLGCSKSFFCLDSLTIS